VAVSIASQFADPIKAQTHTHQPTVIGLKTRGNMAGSFNKATWQNGYL
jgi:hypothetical protein